MANGGNDNVFSPSIFSSINHALSVCSGDNGDGSLDGFLCLAVRGFRCKRESLFFYRNGESIRLNPHADAVRLICGFLVNGNVSISYDNVNFSVIPPSSDALRLR